MERRDVRSSHGTKESARGEEVRGEEFRRSLRTEVGFFLILHAAREALRQVGHGDRLRDDRS